LTTAPRRAGAATAAGATAGAHTERQIEHALDALNFFLADVFLVAMPETRDANA
jgi:hypothetical protein